MGDVRTQQTGDLLPFPGPASRPRRRAIGASEPRGAILLFTGVRYERLPNPGGESPAAFSDGPSRAGRRG